MSPPARLIARRRRWSDDTVLRFAGAGQNTALVFVHLKDWNLRSGATNHAPAIAQRAMRAFSKIRDAQIFALVPPAVQELGQSSGFDVEMEDRGNLGHAGLMRARAQFLGLAAHDPLRQGGPRSPNLRRDHSKNH